VTHLDPHVKTVTAVTRCITPATHTQHRLHTPHWDNSHWHWEERHQHRKYTLFIFTVWRVSV